MRIKTGNVALLVGLSGLLALSGTGTAGAATDLTRSEAKKLSRVGVLKSTDVPDDYFTPARTAGVSDDDDDLSADEVAYNKCLGVSPPAYQTRKVGPTHYYATQEPAKSLELNSSADVAETVAAAAAYQKALGTAKGADCYRERLINTISRNVDAVPKSVTVTTVPATVKGADEAWAYRVTFTIKVKDKDVVGNGHLVGSRVGQALLLVGFTGTGQEFTLAEATDYAAKPAGRVGAKLAEITAKSRPAQPPAKPAPAKPAPAKPAPAANPATPTEPAKPGPSGPLSPPGGPTNPAPEAKPATPTEPAEPGPSGPLTPPGGLTNPAPEAKPATPTEPAEPGPSGALIPPGGPVKP